MNFPLAGPRFSVGSPLATNVDLSTKIRTKTSLRQILPWVGMKIRCALRWSRRGAGDIQVNVVNHKRISLPCRCVTNGDFRILNAEAWRTFTKFRQGKQGLDVPMFLIITHDHQTWSPNR